MFIIIMLLHFIVWFTVIFGAMFSSTLAKFNIFYLYPATYLSYVVFNACILNVFESNLSGDKEFNIVKEKIPNFNVSLYEFTTGLFNNCAQNPASPMGMIIVGFIVSLYSLKYIWNEI